MKNLYLEIMIRLLALIAYLAVFVGVVVFRGDIQTQIKARELANSPAKDELLSQSFVDRILLSDGRVNPNVTSGFWFNKPVTVPTRDLIALLSENPINVLGTSNGEKWIEVDLSTQHLYAHEGDRTVFDFAVSTGLPWFPTITGEFHIWSKLVSTEMIGGSKADGTYYDLPNVPFVQYFYKGFGLHGAYWHNDFGKPRSHGCVNISIPNSQKLFAWTNPALSPNQSALFNISADQGTRVVVHGTTPTNIN